MYTGLLHLHSTLRYVVLILLVVAIVKSLIGWFSGKGFDKTDDRIGLFLMASAHLQLVIGLALYFISPIVEVALADMGAAMKDANLRFWAVEHLTMMIVAIIVITVGRISTKKAATDLKKHQRSAIFYAIAFALIMNAIPWVDRGFF